MKNKENIKNRHFLKIADFSSEEINELLDLSAKFKKMKQAGKKHEYLKGKNIILLFQKTSTRTRSAFEVAAKDLGMGCTYFGSNDSQMGKKETIADTSRVLSRIFDGIEFRGFKHSDIEELANYSQVPVWNGLTNEWHPTQMLSDYLTIRTYHPDLTKIKFAFLGDARFNMSNSYLIMAAKMGVHIAIGAPKKLWPSKEILDLYHSIAKKTGSKLLLTDKPNEAVRKAHVITTDIWVSMGEADSVWKERIDLLYPFQINMDKIKLANKNVIFLHCLPAFHNNKTEISATQSKKFPKLVGGIEVTDEVFEAPFSKVFEEAENRMHTIKAVMYYSLKK